VTEHTGLAEVRELLPGGRLTLGARESFSWAWNGAAFALDTHDLNFEAAAEELRAVASSAVSAWAHEYDNIVLEMSGGLDSSILASLFGQFRPGHVRGIHHMGPDYEGRDFTEAQLAARRAGVPLTALPVEFDRDDMRVIFETPHLARPNGEVLLTNVRRPSVAFCEHVGADCLVAGHGADALFLQRSSAVHQFSDYVRTRGIGAEFWSVAYHTAALRGVPVARVLGDAIDARLHPKRWRPFAFLEQSLATGHRLISQDAVDGVPSDYKWHPWLEAGARLPWGKADQLANVIALYRYYSVCGDSLERDALMPYFSQPIVEFALRTPSYVLVRDGVDRALERAAFNDLLPDEIIQRTMKGAYAIGQIQSKQNNISFLRDLILNGEAIKQGWFDRERLEQALTPASFARGASHGYIDNIAAIEAWLRSWRTLGTTPATQ
jgi:asparagine synthase (glutamine-hydrolysing)